MKLSERRKVADACRYIAMNHGAKVEVLPKGFSGKERETIVHLHWQDLSVGFSIWEVHDGGVLVNFYDAKRDLGHSSVFDSINEHHKRKATTYCDDTGPVFMRWFEAMCKEVRDGEVFEEGC